MKEIPNFNRRSCGNYYPRHRYRFQDLDCRYCIEHKTCPAICLCPYILDNLTDLKQDMEFIKAVLAAELCDTPQKRTLRYLMKQDHY